MLTIALSNRTAISVNAAVGGSRKEWKIEKHKIALKKVQQEETHDRGASTNNKHRKRTFYDTVTTIESLN